MFPSTLQRYGQRVAGNSDVAIEGLHQTIREAAASLWSDGYYRQAVVEAAEALAQHVKAILGRRDIGDTAAWQKVFAERGSECKEPCLRWPGDPTDRTVRSINEGLRHFAPGAYLLIRNTAVHSTDALSRQDALERLAVLSLLARYVDGCETICVDERAAV